ncbi:YdcF family protein [Methylosinus sp. LW4]|uniref:YdcF family protein n=1 Tax=Methylosinus sp. LW4 TaxID=136993 RepID=UPI00038122E4|nr:YdcF family protein [Methylosinus sp. LW4]
MTPDAIVVLAHLMEQDGTLGVETRKRADKAAELHAAHKCPVILMGWAYRGDTDLCISDAIASYLKSTHQIGDDALFIDRDSRDTVGDAILSKKKFEHLLSGKNVGVVTSDYHVDRTRRIFEFVYGEIANILVFGVQTEIPWTQVSHEQESLSAFSRTFAGVESGDDRSIFNALVQNHPFYNGKIYPVLAG